MCAGNPRRVFCAIKINSFQNFKKSLKTCSAGRKDFFDTLAEDGWLFFGGLGSRLRCFRRKGIAFQILLEPDGEFAVFLHVVEVGVGSNVAVPLFDDADGDVGAVVADTLEIVQQIVEHKAQLDGALAGLQAADVAAADLVGQAVHGLLQRFHLLGGDGVILPEAGEGGVQNVLHQVGQNAQLLPGRVGKAELLVMQLLGGLLKI